MRRLLKEKLSHGLPFSRWHRRDVHDSTNAGVAAERGNDCAGIRMGH